MAESAAPDKRAARRAFARAAAGYDAHAILQREVGARLLQHLDPIRIDPARVLDLGCGTGALFAGLRERFPRARLVGVDAALPMLRAARGRTPWWRALAGNVPLVACARSSCGVAAGTAGALRTLTVPTARQPARDGFGRLQASSR